MYSRCATILNLIKYWSIFQSSYFFSEANFNMNLCGWIQIQNNKEKHCSVYNGTMSIKAAGAQWCAVGHRLWLFWTNRHFAWWYEWTNQKLPPPWPHGVGFQESWKWVKPWTHFLPGFGPRAQAFDQHPASIICVGAGIPACLPLYKSLACPCDLRSRLDSSGSTPIPCNMNSGTGARPLVALAYRIGRIGTFWAHLAFLAW